MGYHASCQTGILERKVYTKYCKKVKGPRLLDVEMESLRVSHPENLCLALAEETATSWEP